MITITPTTIRTIAQVGNPPSVLESESAAGDVAAAGFGVAVAEEAV